MERENNGPSKCRERWGGCARREPQGEDPEVRQLLERDGNAKHRAFIAWGLITALFIPDGWLPNATLAALVAPMITYLLPLLIGYTGGRLVYDVRGGVVGAVATMGVIVGTDIPMFLGALIMGPLGGFVIKRFDRLIEGRVRQGFE